MKTIIITGTPGTGKTTLAKRLAKRLNYHYIDVNKLISKYKLSEGYDSKRRTKIIDINKLNKKIIGVMVFFKMSANRKAISDDMSERERRSELSHVTAQKPKVFDKYNFIGIAPMSSARRAKLIKKIILNIRSNNKDALKNVKKIKKYTGIIIDSHLSHYLPRKYVDFCIVTKCDIKELNKRLKKKKFHKGKIQENIQAEIFDVCYNEALERKHKVLVVNTAKGFNINKIANQIGV